jgi:putative ABC transport system permease protein
MSNPPIVRLLLTRCALRHWRAAPRQTLLLVLILALGVGVFTAVRLANRAAVASFTHFTDTLTGQSDWLIQAPSGPLPETVLPALRALLTSQAVQIHPVVESTALLAATPGEASLPTEARWQAQAFTLLGVDLVAVANLPRQQAADKAAADGAGFFARENSSAARGGATEGGEFWSALRDSPGVWLSPDFPARETPLHLDLLINDQPVRAVVRGRIPRAAEAPAPPARLLVMDLPQLQTLVGRPGQVDRVEFILEPGLGLAARRAEVGEILRAAGTDADGRWTAFRMNLAVLSLIALLVGLYLVFQALDGAVVRRRAEIAVLRSLGVEARAIQRAWLAEAAVLGLAGGALGLLLGWAGAQGAVRAVGQTINALYYSTTVASAALAWPEIALGLVAGVLAALIAGWWPARAAADTPPAQVLGRGTRAALGARWLRSPTAAVGLLALGGALTLVPPLALAGGGRFPLAGHLASFCGIAGGGVVAALALPWLARALRPLGRGWLAAKLALSHLAQATGRHRLAAAALVCAIGMAAAMAVMVGSFERTVRGWVATALQADLFVSSVGALSASSDNRMAPATWRALAAHPAVAHASVFTAHDLELAGLTTLLGGGDLRDQQARGGFIWTQPPRDQALFDTATSVDLAAVSESFAERFSVARGDTLIVPTPTGGPRTLRIAGVFADYGNERGSLLVDRAHLVQWFGGDDHATSLGLYLHPGIDAAALRSVMLANQSGLLFHTNATLRAEVLKVFRQTFAITYALEVIGVLVAVVGLALTLVSVLLDRRDELTTLRALGLTHAGIARATALEGAGLALCAGLVGVGLSLALGWVLIHVINKQSFGWTLAMHVPWGGLGALLGAIVITGAAVSYGVGRWGARLPADREPE